MYFCYQLQFNKINPISAEILAKFPNQNTAEIIDQLEKNNKIHQLDIQALKIAINFVNSYNLPCSINISPLTLNIENIVDYIFSIMPIKQNINFELTEAYKLNDKGIVNFKRLYYNGYTIFIDDYGKSHNGLNLLCSLPFSGIKIDKYLIGELNNTIFNKANTIIESTIDLAKKLNLQVIAEGVETQEQFDILEEIDCHQKQGFFLHKPIKIKQVKH